MRQRSSLRRGFTLLEVIVATTIMAIAVTALLAGLSGAVRNASRLRDHDRVVQMARLRMNELLVDPALGRNASLGGRFEGALAGGLDAGWEAQITPFATPPALVPGTPALDRVALEVWWNDGGGRHTFRLEGYREHVLTADEIVGAGAP
jgi:general secretion pathway protein I